MGELFLESTKEFFLKWPQLKAFSWSQFTPYYYPFEFQINLDSIQFCNEDGDICEMSQEIKDFLNLYQTEFYLNKFGDHAKVIVTENKIQIVDYDNHN